MGESFSFLARPFRITDLIVDGDLDLGTHNVKAAKAYLDHIAEKTTSHGIVSDAGGLSVPGALAGASLAITGTASAAQVNTDHIAEKTAAAGIHLLNDVTGNIPPASTFTRYTGNGGTTVFISAAVPLGSSDTNYSVKRRFQFPVNWTAFATNPITVKVKTTIAGSGGYYCWCKITKNGTQVVERSATTSTTYTDDISVAPGDYIDVWIRTNNSSGSATLSLCDIIGVTTSVTTTTNAVIAT